MNSLEHNRTAWNYQVDHGNRWTVPVGADAIEAARRGHWHIVLTATKAIPADWLGDVNGQRILCLASGGGQQGPILAAAGAQVTVLDNSPRQLEQDASVARAHDLPLDTVLGDMASLTMFDDGQFDLVVHPVSNCFAPHIQPVWNESHRVLRPGGALLAGFVNPLVYVFDQDLMEREGRLVLKHRLPYSDADSLSPDEVAARLRDGLPLEFGHTLEQQIGGQLRAGFVLTDLYEDSDVPDPADPLHAYTPKYVATRAVKLRRD